MIDHQLLADISMDGIREWDPHPSFLPIIRYLIAINLEQKVKKNVRNVNIYLKNSFKRQLSLYPLYYISIPTIST